MRPGTAHRCLDAVFNNTDENHPGYMIGVMRADKFLFQKGYGLANPEHEIPIDAQTNFNIASLSKQITAAAIALCMMDGKVDFEDLVASHLEDFPFAKDSMRVKHLIYMTSGINDYTYNPRKNRDGLEQFAIFQHRYGHRSLLWIRRIDVQAGNAMVLQQH
ncbi:MAG: serine hydrolase domain-containing protein [Bacteroidota bacterium]